ncbi:hypothetical protein BJV82DRAFT_625367 [Fennellomyces sp. T-0311]|nr:hypothetical protein BJV82DRAFT_625367 [Fennellomyces sp. T-0311]
MTKRRHSVAETVEDTTKRQYFGGDLDVVDDAIDTLIHHCIATSTDDMIVRSTEVLDRLNSGCATVLLARADALANKGKLEDAVSDALTAIKHQRISVAGYLLAGVLYSTQGKQQAAMDICERGLRTVLPSEWPLLYEKREEAKEILERKFDFVTKLPTEITATIFAQLYSTEYTLVSCTGVSKRWREYMLQQYPALWRNSVIILNSGYIRPVTRLLPAICSHVQRLSLDHTPDHILQKLLNMSESNKLSLVKDIVIETPPPCLIDHHVQLLTLFQSNLTSLKIKFTRRHRHSMLDTMQRQSQFELDTIMSLCSNLKYLELQSHHGIITYRPQHSFPLGGYPLERLAIGVPQMETILEELIPRCPRLQALDMMETTPRTMRLIDEQCQQLSHLKVRYGFYSEESSIFTYNNQDTAGLSTLQYYSDNGVLIQNLLPFFTKSKNTLKTLELVVDEMDTPTGSSPLAQVAFTRLNVLYLVFRGFNANFATAIASMIRQSPTLNDVTLVFDGASIPDEFLQSLTPHTQLGSLTLCGFHSPSAGLEHLFSHFAARHQACTLQSIVVEDCDGVTDGVLSALADITTLQKIELRRSFENVWNTGMVAFMQKLRTLPCLESLSLASVPQINDDNITQLAEIDGLQKLMLFTLREITSKGVCALADNLRTLKTVVIEDSSGVDDNAIRYLESKLVFH